MKKSAYWKALTVFMVLLVAVLAVPFLGKVSQKPFLKTEEKGTEMAAPTQAGWALVRNNDEVNLLARLIAAEAMGEPYEGQVAVGAVLLNRVRHASFPNTISGVIYQPHAFESVSNGLIWRVTDLTTARRAAYDALNGWDPTYGCLYFWNPSEPVSKWIWSRKIVRKIGNHVFGI